MVAVRTRTAGQPALRRRIIIEQPGICMPGAAACALQRSACAATSTLPVPLSQRPLALPLPPAAPFSLPSFLPAFLRLTASHFATGVMSLASVPGARRCSRAAIAVAHRAEASSTPVSGMDIADRNAVAAVRRTASHRRFRLRRGVCGTGRGAGSVHQGCCVLPDRVAYVVQCARRLLRKGNSSAADPPWGWSSREVAERGSNNAGKEGR